MAIEVKSRVKHIRKSSHKYYPACEILQISSLSALLRTCYSQLCIYEFLLNCCRLYTLQRTVVTYAYNSHVVRINSHVVCIHLSDCIVSCYSRTDHMYNICAFIIQLLSNSLEILNGIILVPLDILQSYPLDKSREQSTN